MILLVNIDEGGEGGISCEFEVHPALNVSMNLAMNCTEGRPEPEAHSSAIVRSCSPIRYVFTSNARSSKFYLSPYVHLKTFQSVFGRHQLHDVKQAPIT